MKAGKETIKYINKQNILNVFREKNEVTKAEIMGVTKLSAATVSNLIQELMEETLLTEKYYGESSGGRKPMIYSLNGERVRILTLKVTAKGILAGIVNLKGEIIWHKSLPVRIHDEATFRSAMKEAAAQLKEQQRNLMEQISIVAYSIPGVICYSTRSIVYSAALYLENVDLQALSDRLFNKDMEVYVFKDTDALILGEYYGTGKDSRNMVYLLCDQGVGMSVISEGNLLRLTGCGLEIGHTTIDLHGLPCKCSSTGCVGTLLGEKPAAAQYTQIYETIYPETIFDGTTLSYDVLIDRSLEGKDKIASRVMREQIELLSVVVVNTVNLFNPDLVVIGGPVARIPEMAGTVEAWVKKKALKPFTSSISIKAPTLGNHASLYGMAEYVLDKEVFTAVSIRKLTGFLA